jgi:cell division protein FtsX
VSNLIVVRNEIDGWDVVRSDDPQALTNTPTRESAVEAAEKILADEGGEGEVLVNERAVHPLDDTSRGVKTYVIALLGLLLVITVIIVVTSLLASATLD